MEAIPSRRASPIETTAAKATTGAAVPATSQKPSWNATAAVCHDGRISHQLGAAQPAGGVRPPHRIHRVLHPRRSSWARAPAPPVLQLARDDALVFGDHEGRYLHPERFTRTFRPEVVRCRKTIGDEAVPEIRLHDLRHTHATLLLAKGVPVKVVSERLGHASATITLQVYAHVMPGNQRDAAELFGSLIKGEMHDEQTRNIRAASRAVPGWPCAALTCADVVSEGGLEPPCPLRALAPQASASAYSATRTSAGARDPVSASSR